jgi:hypothetical protein
MRLFEFYRWGIAIYGSPKYGPMFKLVINRHEFHIEYRGAFLAAHYFNKTTYTTTTTRTYH